MDGGRKASRGRHDYIHAARDVSRVRHQSIPGPWALCPVPSKGDSRHIHTVSADSARNTGGQFDSTPESFLTRERRQSSIGRPSDHRMRIFANRFLTAIVLALLARVSSAQSVVPLAAAADMSRVVVRDTLIVPPAVKREFRGVWVSPAGDADWPSRAGLPADAQQRELIALLDRAKELGLNAIIFHVRLSGDALYETPLAPWSAKLTGYQGVSPGYDPLAVVVREAHARGLVVHAWFNPFRASLDGGLKAAPNHVTRIHASWVRRYGRDEWIDPGVPDARSAVIETVLDVVRRYDIDGVHIDDYFYPYRETVTRHYRVGKGKHRHTLTSTREIDFPDQSSWRKYGLKARWRDRDDWRRHNIDDFVAQLYFKVHQIKPYVAVGVSPFGIWRPDAVPGVQGLDAYREIYADSRKWLREGWLDYLAPQLYWPIDGAQNRFRLLDSWWRSPSQNPKSRHVWPGLYTAGPVIGGAGGMWAPDEIAHQIAYLRQQKVGTLESDGHVHFRMGSLGGVPGIATYVAGPVAATPVTTRLGELVEQESYRAPALVPEMPWIGGKPPAMPVAAAVATAGGMVKSNQATLLIGAGDTTSLEWWLIQSRDASGNWTSQLMQADVRQVDLTQPPFARAGEPPDVVVVTAIDRAGQESKRAIVRVRPR